jgi:hypothetical protein
VKNQPEEIESKYTIFTPSAALSMLLNQLTPLQRRAVPLIVSYDLQGKPLEALFDKANPDRICNRSLYQRVWKKKKVFVTALDLARSEARTTATANVVIDTVQRLRQIAPLAANDLERQIVGDEYAVQALKRVAGNGKRPLDERGAAIEALGKIGTRATTDVLLKLINNADPEVRKVAALQLGVSASGLNTQRRMADVAVLDRADRMTANKGGAADEAHELSDEELERIAAGK